jgi:hypothetical protein
MSSHGQSNQAQCRNVKLGRRILPSISRNVLRSQHILFDRGSAHGDSEEGYNCIIPKMWIQSKHGHRGQVWSSLHWGHWLPGDVHRAIPVAHVHGALVVRSGLRFLLARTRTRNGVQYQTGIRSERVVLAHSGPERAPLKRPESGPEFRAYRNSDHSGLTSRLFKNIMSRL